MSGYGDITLLIAHPDDEIIFLWPFLEAAKRIVCCVSDAKNPARAWCSRRKDALAEVAALVGAEMTCLGVNSEFYRMPTRDASLKRFAESLAGHLRGVVATHNPWGEYGHIDHILTHLWARMSGFPVLCTDIAQEVNWMPVKPFIPGREINRGTHFDPDLYARCKAIYDRYGCWTWSQPPIEVCKVYEC